MTDPGSNDLPTDFQESLQLISKLFNGGCSLDIISSSLGINLDLVKTSVALVLKDPANLQRLLDCSTSTRSASSSLQLGTLLLEDQTTWRVIELSSSPTRIYARSSSLPPYLVLELQVIPTSST